MKCDRSVPSYINLRWHKCFRNRTLYISWKQYTGHLFTAGWLTLQYTTSMLHSDQSHCPFCCVQCCSTHSQKNSDAFGFTDHSLITTITSNTDTLMPITSSCLWTRQGTWVADGTHQAFTFKCLSHHGTKACILPWKKLLSSEIMWNANLMQQGNFIDTFLAWHVSGTYAHHQEH